MKGDIKKSYSFFSTYNEWVSREKGIKFFWYSASFSRKIDFEIPDVASSRVQDNLP